MKTKLLRNKQCAKCPWKKSTNPYDIPDGYSLKAHKKLKSTISAGFNVGCTELRLMACHESPIGKETHCVGWLMNQLGPGNNIALRLEMRNYDLSQVQLDGEQHETFEDTLPR